MKAHKQFDCVRMKREIQARKLGATAGLSPDERASEMARSLEAGPFADIWRAAHRLEDHRIDGEPEPRAA